MNTVTTLTEYEVPSQNIPIFDKSSTMMSGIGIKNIIIFILVILLVFSLMGINLIQSMSDIVEYIGNLVGPILSKLLSAFAYITGITLNTTTDVIGDTAKTGIDIAENTLQSIGNILIDVSKRDNKMEISEKIESSKKDEPTDEPEPDYSGTSIQNSISSKKASWCLVGDQNQRRSCASVQSADKCMSGNIFPTHESCLNPNLITNVLPDKQRTSLVN